MIVRLVLALVLLLSGATASAEHIPCASQFSDTQYLTRGAGLTGVSDSQTLIFSALVKSDNTTSYRRVFSNSTGGQHITLQRATGQAQFQFFGANAAGVRVFLGYSGNFTDDYDWHHVLASVDLSIPKIHYYIDDVLNNVAPVQINDTIDFTHTDWIVGANDGGGNPWNGGIAQLYFAPGQFLDFSVVSNRRLFISASGKPVSLGMDGSKPTGTAPAIFLRRRKNFGTNFGTGGDFTPDSVSLDTAKGPLGYAKQLGRCTGRIPDAKGGRLTTAGRGGLTSRGGRAR